MAFFALSGMKPLLQMIPSCSLTWSSTGNGCRLELISSGNTTWTLFSQKSGRQPPLPPVRHGRNPKAPPPPQPVHQPGDVEPEEEEDAASVTQTALHEGDEPNRRWGLDALGIRNDIAMMLRNMAQNDEVGEACHAAGRLYRHFQRPDETRTGSLRWVEALIRPELDKYILRVSRPSDYELDPDMEEWLQRAMKAIDACAWTKDRGVLEFRERRKRRRASAFRPPGSALEPTQSDPAAASSTDEPPRFA